MLRNVKVGLMAGNWVLVGSWNGTNANGVQQKETIVDSIVNRLSICFDHVPRLGTITNVMIIIGWHMKMDLVAGMIW